MLHLLFKPKQFLLGLVLFSLSQSPRAQEYKFPVNPGRKAYLTGSVGEIRRNHFHAGLDVAVATGTPVYAADDGYVYRIKVSTYGYGRVIYIDHPRRKHRTVYAHLNGFNEGIGNYVRQRQYEQENFEIELFPDSLALPIRKGQIIGYTGNSGSSGGPHLHYEIRDWNDVALNPMNFGFKEIPSDRLPPIISKIAVESLNSEGRVNGVFGRSEYNAKKVGAGRYAITPTIPVYGTIGLEILTHDVINGAYSIYGTTNVQVRLDGQLIYTHDLNKIAHEYNRCMNVHVNYGVYRRRYQGFQKCYLDDGNRLPFIYKDLKNKGKINIRDEGIHQVEIQARDPWGNLSRLNFKIKGRKNQPRFIADRSVNKAYLRHQVKGNTLKIIAHHLKNAGDSLNLFFNGIRIPTPLAYMQGNKAVYLWNLQQGIPDFAEVAGIRKNFQIKMLIPSDKEAFYRDDRLQIRFPEGALFDTLYLEPKLNSQSLQLQNADEPLFSEIEVSYLPTARINSVKTAMFYNGSNYQYSEWQDSLIHFKTRSLGNFQIKQDLLPPQVQLKSKSTHRVQFYIRDDGSGIDTYKASLNGQFLLFNYDFKTRSLVSERKNKQQILKGKLVLKVWDRVGNVKVFQTQI